MKGVSIGMLVPKGSDVCSRERVSRTFCKSMCTLNTGEGIQSGNFRFGSDD